jgi:predicted DNA-binding ribbon-helix-helix protein
MFLALRRARGKDGREMASLKKRSFSLSGHRTSVALEEEFWTVLEDEARKTGRSLATLVQTIDVGRGSRPLASALRLHALAVNRTHL